MPLSRAYQLEEPSSSSTIELYYDKSYQTLMEKLKEPNPAYQIHPRFDTILRDYQKDGVKWLLKLHQYHLSGIFADDMGLGKSIQVIALLESVKLDKPSILVVPASLIYNWQEETKKFETTLSVLCIKGSRAARKEQIQKINQYDLIITSYDYLKRDLEDYEQIDFAYVILDEAQYIKNLKTQNAHSVKHLQSEYRLALSGTPIENTLAELWSVFDFLMPGYLYPYARFNKEYEKQIVRRQDEYKIKRLKQMVSPFILRRTKKEVLAELPEKTEVNIYVPFEKEEERLYLANLAKINENLAELFEQEHVSQIQILAMMTRLRQLCCEPRVVYDNIHRLFSKLKETIALCHKLKQNGQKILLFSNFTKILELIEKELAVNQFSYLKLTGSNTKEQRAKMVQVFQEGNTDIFLISLKAGGTGLNLTKASAVIHYDPWWNLSAQNQASDRAHRIGQESKVTVYKMIMENSIEEKIAQLQLRKQELADLFIEGSEFSLSQMSEDEIYSLFQRKQ